MVRTPLQPGEWGKCLAQHPDGEYQADLMRGMHEGSRVGFKYGKSQYQSATVNMKSATENPTVVGSVVLGKRMTSRPSDRPSEEGRLAESAGQSFWCYTKAQPAW